MRSFVSKVARRFVPAYGRLAERSDRLTIELQAAKAALAATSISDVNSQSIRMTRLRNIEELESLQIQLSVHAEGDVVSDCIYKFGHWEAIETKFVLANVAKGGTVLDLGANVGYYTAIFSALVGSAGKVFSFEPDDENFYLLLCNTRSSNYRNVFPFKTVISDKLGVAELRLHDDSNRGGHMAVPVVHAGFDKRMYHPKLSLDDLFAAGVFDRVDFIKMDTQGSEPLIISGGRRLLERNRGHLKLVMEFSPVWIQSFHKIRPIDFYSEICNLGFEAYYIDPLEAQVKRVVDPAALIDRVSAADGVSWTRDATSADLIFLPKS